MSVNYGTGSFTIANVGNPATVDANLVFGSTGGDEFGWACLGDRTMAHPAYFATDIVALTLAAALAVAVVLIGFHLMHELAHLPPALSGSH